MKNLFAYILLALFATGLNSCAKSTPSTTEEALSQEVINQINALGFSADDAYAADGGYIVEGDIFLTDADLHSQEHGLVHNLAAGNAEQYRTTNMVTGLPRTITISASGSVSTNVSNAINAAIGRYNAEGLQITLSRVTSGGTINIKVVNGGNYIASAGFPSGGNPFPEVKFNKTYQNWQLNTLASVFAHEIGHCVGMRHTDYMDRSFSCGGGYANEGDGGVGAIFIPNTSVPAENGSWMLACIGNGDNRNFTNNDKTALNFLF